MKFKCKTVAIIAFLLFASVAVKLCFSFWFLPVGSQAKTLTLRGSYHNSIKGEAVVVELIDNGNATHSEVLQFNNGAALLYTQFCKVKLPSNLNKDMPIKVTLNWECRACGSKSHTESVSTVFDSAKDVYRKGLFIYPQYLDDDYRTYLHFISGDIHKCYLKNNGTGVWEESASIPKMKWVKHDEMWYTRFVGTDDVVWK